MSDEVKLSGRVFFFWFKEMNCFISFPLNFYLYKIKFHIK